MILIIEGPRCAGKTTIAHKVVDILNESGITAQYKKFSRADDPIEDMKQRVLEFDRIRSIVYVIDRFHLTELVMRLADGTVMPSILNRKIKTIDGLLGRAEASIVVLKTSQQVLKRRVEERNDGRGQEMGSLGFSECLWEDATRNFWVDYILSTETQRHCDFAVGFLANVCKKGLNK